MNVSVCARCIDVHCVCMTHVHVYIYTHMYIYVCAFRIIHKYVYPLVGCASYTRSLGPTPPIRITVLDIRCSNN